MAVQAKRREGTEEFDFLKVKMIHRCNLWSTENGDYTLLFKASELLTSHTFVFNFLDIQ